MSCACVSSVLAWKPWKATIHAVDGQLSWVWGWQERRRCCIGIHPRQGSSCFHRMPQVTLHASLLLRCSSCSGTPCTRVDATVWERRWSLASVQGQAGSRALGLCLLQESLVICVPRAQEGCFAGLASVSSTVSLLGLCHASGLLSPCIHTCAFMNACICEAHVSTCIHYCDTGKAHQHT